MPGPFDDLIPAGGKQQPVAQGADPFADLVPQQAVAPQAAPAAEKPSLWSLFTNAFTRGSASSLAGTLHSGADLVDQTVGGAIRSVAEPLGLGATFNDPLGAAAVAHDSLGAEREINADRDAAMQGGTQQKDFYEALNPNANANRAQAAAEFGEPGNFTPLTMGDRMDAVGGYGKRLLSMGAESLPMFLAAIATRNPEIASAAMGSVTGAQEYTDLRTQGVERSEAVPAAALTGMIETAGEGAGLPAVMAPGRGWRGIAHAAASEGLQEAPVQVAQQNVEDVATGKHTPVLQQLADAFDAFTVGAGLGAGGHVASVAGDKLAGRADAAPDPHVRRGPELTPEDIAFSQSQATPFADLVPGGKPAQQPAAEAPQAPAQAAPEAPAAPAQPVAETPVQAPPVAPVEQPAQPVAVEQPQQPVATPEPPVVEQPAEVPEVPPQVAAETPIEQPVVEQPVATPEVPAVATHEDPGEAPQVTTPAVVAESVQKSADNTSMDLPAARKHLLGKVDEAIATASDEVLPEEQGMRDVAIQRIGYVTFDVPGDGKFKVLNTKQHLAAFRAKVSKTQGFTAKVKQPGLPGPTTGSSPETVMRGFVADDEPGNAYEYGKAKGVPLRYGEAEKGAILAYAAAKPEKIDGFPQAYSALLAHGGGPSENGTWSVVDPETGRTLSNKKQSRAAAVAAANDSIKKAGGGAALYENAAHLRRDAKPEAEREAAWLKSIGHEPAAEGEPEAPKAEKPKAATAEDSPETPEAPQQTLEDAKKEWAENLGFEEGQWIETPYGPRQITGLMGQYVSYYVNPKGAADGTDLSHGSVKATSAKRIEAPKPGTSRKAETDEKHARHERLAERAETIAMPAKKGKKSLATITVAQDDDGKWYSKYDYFIGGSSDGAQGSSSPFAHSEPFEEREEAVAEAAAQILEQLPKRRHPTNTLLNKQVAEVHAWAMKVIDDTGYAVAEDEPTEKQPLDRTKYRGNVGWDTVPIGDTDKHGDALDGLAQELKHLYGKAIRGTITTVDFDGKGKPIATEHEDSERKAYVLVDFRAVPIGVGGKKKMRAMDAGIFWGLPLAYDAGSAEFRTAAMQAAAEFAAANGIEANPKKFPGAVPLTKSGRHSTAKANQPVAEEDEEFDDDVDALRDEVRRRKQRKSRKKVTPITSTRKVAELAHELNLFEDHGYDATEVANMSPREKMNVAKSLVARTFGFAKVDVDNNLNTLEAINQLLFGYRNMQSLAAVLGWPSKTIGKIAPNLQLSRDGAGALASYSPGDGTIMVSRQNDAFAHEFGHGIDWWVWKKLGLVDPMTGAPRGRAATGKLRLGGELRNKPIERAFQDMLGAMFETEGDAAFKIAAIEKQILVIRNEIARLKEREANTPDPDRRRTIAETIAKREGHILRLAAQIKTVAAETGKTYTRPTDYYLGARLMDRHMGMEGGDGGGYWQRPTEMMARAFEAWVSDRVEQHGGETQMLGRTDAGYQEATSFIENAYPQAIDRERIFAAIDDLARAIRDTATAGVKGDAAEVQMPDPLPPAAWMDHPTHKVEAVNFLQLARDSMDEANSRLRAAGKIRDERRKADKAVRDVRNNGKVMGVNVGKAVADFAMRMDDAQLSIRDGLAVTISGFLDTMQARYPHSPTIAKVARTFSTDPGTGKIAGQTHGEYRKVENARWGNKLGRIVDRHKLLSDKHWTDEERRDVHNAMVDPKKAADRPAYSANVLAAAADLRTFHNELWMALQNAGMNIGYADNGYLQRLMRPEAVSANTRGFLEQASKVYELVFDKEVGSVDKAPLNELMKYAHDLAALGKMHPLVQQFRERVFQLNKIENPKAQAEAEQELREWLESSGLYDEIRTAFSREAAEDWMGRILGTTAGDDFSVEGAQGKWAKSRVLPPEADLLLQDYKITDVASLSATYMTSAVNRMAFEKFLPPPGDRPQRTPAGRIADLAAAMHDEGVLPDDVEEAVKSIELMAGLYRPTLTKKGLRFQSTIVAGFGPVVLGRALFSQFQEPATAAVKTGNPIDTLAIFKSQLQDLAAVLPGIQKIVTNNVKDRIAWRHEMAEFAGAVTNAHFDTIINNRQNTLYSNTEAARKVANFYLYSGIHPHAMSMRRATVERSTYYMKRIAKKALKFDKAAIRDLADLGIGMGDRALVEYLANEMPLMPSVHEIKDSPHAHKIVVAINRFVNGVTLDPDIVDKPRLASTPEYAFLYAVLAYQVAFHRRVLTPARRKIMAAWRDDGLSAGAREAAITSAMIGMHIGMTLLPYLLRTALYGDLDKELEKWEEQPSMALATLISRAGYFGGYDPFINAALSVKYNRSLSQMATGAYIGYGTQAGDRVLQGYAHKSDTTNTAEYNRVVGLYELVVAPLIAHLILSRVPFAAPALQLTSSSRFEKFVAETLVGPKGTRTAEYEGEKSGNAADTRHNGRHNNGKGAAGGRGSSR